MPAIDLLRVVCQSDRPDDRPAAQRLVGALDLQILGQNDAVAIGEEVADGVSHFRGLSCCLLGLGFRGRNPFALVELTCRPGWMTALDIDGRQSR